ncbi:MAG: HupE/UreJ family protein [Gemmatimonadota bacterium]|nr:HupE/UreJ family protein [Gemmatimonadota bacterium]
MFAVYLELGFEHLLDLRGYDHILFLAGLCAAYSLARWRELLVLVTAFTIGHSVSLALATLRLVSVNSSLVEFLIPVTIVATALTNLAGLWREGGRARQPREDPAEHRVAARPLRYALALAFGVIHGLGFSNFLRIALGDERNLFVPLLSFNIGLELAQIVVAGAVLALGAAVVSGVRALRAAAKPETGFPRKAWNAAVSLAVGTIAATMALQRWPW